MKTRKTKTIRPLKINKTTFEPWLAKQAHNRVFDYMSNGGCLIASYLRETGIAPNAEVGGSLYRLSPMHDVFTEDNSIKFNRFLTKLANLALHSSGPGLKFTVRDFRKSYLAS